MCLVCKDWLAGKITTKEAWRNLHELHSIDTDNMEEQLHYFEVAEKLAEKENNDLKN
jgi:hypothetical protein